MKPSRVVSVIPVIAAGLFFVTGLATAEDAEYIGAKKCSMCHKKAEDGEQFKIWSESAHAKAFETLASEEAKAEAAKHGIEDPQAAPECLKCHATAFAVMDDLENQKITLEEGVSCESCHGAGSNYYKKATMEGITAGEIDGASVGLVHPDEAMCKTCHTPEGNSFFKEFNFEERVAKIAHPIPEAEAAAE
ncbi:MAG TPA: cytochrome c family protein [bacterium]|nr:cytochrome c family protein [bacterium]